MALPASPNLGLMPVSSDTHKHFHAHHHHHANSIWTKVHGEILIFTFSFMFPVGILLLNLGFKKGAVFHWRTQAAASVLSLVAMGVMMVQHWGSVSVSTDHL
jgi:hypothetical protein